MSKYDGGDGSNDVELLVLLMLMMMVKDRENHLQILLFHGQVTLPLHCFYFFQRYLSTPHLLNW